MKLYFVRHGKTTWNAEGRFQGANGDSPLTIEGKEELQRLGLALSTTAFDAVYTSPLKRAQDSAAILMANNQTSQKTIEVTKALEEWHLGRLEGQKITTIQGIYPKQINAFYHNLGQFDHNVFAAESVYQATNRICDFVKSLNPNTVEQVLLVSHGAILTASIRRLLGYEIPELRQKGGLNNASLTLLETTDNQNYRLLDWNDTDYEAIAERETHHTEHFAQPSLVANR
ncbi:histidine phosphatase family protein [Streptococcus sp. DD12]|uniref:histidine phosphatase family protein n=1 Tax=Streptococcus sp. DD12 TaxID=1777880 RepID=UPI000794EE92|nr:histidine phosphatase family protein [Streptococcus sp. DD12]KXT76381.1 Phosphoglycerate mutase family 5 [Streptococcus sp. DD12]